MRGKMRNCSLRHSRHSVLTGSLSPAPTLIRLLTSHAKPVTSLTISSSDKELKRLLSTRATASSCGNQIPQPPHVASLPTSHPIPSSPHKPERQHGASHNYCHSYRCLHTSQPLFMTSTNPPPPLSAIKVTSSNVRRNVQHRNVKQPVSATQPLPDQPTPIPDISTITPPISNSNTTQKQQQQSTATPTSSSTPSPPPPPPPPPPRYLSQSGNEMERLPPRFGRRVGILVAFWVTCGVLYFGSTVYHSSRGMIDDQWKSVLSDDDFKIIRLNYPEMPYTGEYVNHWESGVYRCKCCGTPLFRSDSKFDSGFGWASFCSALTSDNSNNPDKLNVKSRWRNVQRVELDCVNCQAHVGQIFGDGPPQHGSLRYNVNSAALTFQPNDATPSNKPSDIAVAEAQLSPRRG